MVFNPAIIGKALKVKDLAKQVSVPIAIYEAVEDRENGAGVYIFQAKFIRKVDAERFAELARLSADLEKFMEG